LRHSTKIANTDVIAAFQGIRIGDLEQKLNIVSQDSKKLVQSGLLQVIDASADTDLNKAVQARLGRLFRQVIRARHGKCVVCGSTKTMQAARKLSHVGINQSAI
jgi:hypothetical protein